MMDLRTRIVAASALLLFLSASAGAQMIELFDEAVRVTVSGGKSGNLGFKIDVAKIPVRLSFDPARGGPIAITRDRAVALAREAAAKDGHTDLKERHIQVVFIEGKALGDRSFLPDEACLWYYLVEFNYSQKGNLRYAVLLNEVVLKEN